MPDIEPELPAVEASQEETPSLEQEPETPETPVEPEHLYAGKYKTPEDLERAYQEMQALQGRQSGELGELRQLIEQQQQTQQRPSPDQILAYADENPAYATAVAMQQYGRGSVPYEQTLRAWAESDSISAARFDTEMRIQEMQSQFEPQLKQYGLNAAMNQLTSKYPDVAEYGEAIMREAETSPVVLALQQQGQDISASVLETLYLAARGRQGLAQTHTQAHDANLSRQQKLQAGVASATAARPGEPGPRNPDDDFRDEYVRAAQDLGLIPRE